MNTIISNINQTIRKTDLRLTLSISLFGAFMLCIFAPFEIYLSNKDSFFFGGEEMVAFSLILFVVSFFACSCLLAIINIISTTAYQYCASIIFALFLGLYIQGNYNPTDYGSLDGTSIDWSQYRVAGILSAASFIIIILLLIILCAKLQLAKISKALSAVSICIVLVQIVTLSTLLLSHNGLGKSGEYVATEDNKFHFSSDNNLIVLVLDSYDASIMSEILANDSELYYSNLLKDFTYYPDTVGMYSYTGLAIPYIITGKEYHNETTYGEYLIDGYKNSPLLNALDNNNWYTGIYSEVIMPNNEISKRVDNCELIHKTVSSHRRLAGYIYRLVSFRYAPQQLKQLFWFYSDEMQSAIGSNDQDAILYGDSNKKFMDSLDNVTVDTNQNVFELIHLYGAHQPYTLNADNTIAEHDTTVQDVSKAMIEMINAFTTRLKECDAYDNSTIIVCADHGTFTRQAPLLMIKYANANHMLVQSDIPVSYSHLQDIFVSLINSKDENEVKNLLSSYESESRKYLSYTHVSLGYDSYCTDITEYAVNGYSQNEGNIKNTGIIYAGK